MIFVVSVFLIIGCFFALAGTIGVLRMPDTFCRMQSSTNIATLGTLGVVIGAAIYSFINGNLAMGMKVILIGLFITLTNPISGHAICRAAYKYGIRPEKEMVCDEYGRENPNE